MQAYKGEIVKGLKIDQNTLNKIPKELGDAKLANPMSFACHQRNRHQATRLCLSHLFWDDVVEAAKHAYEILMKDEDLDALLEAEKKRVVEFNSHKIILSLYFSPFFFNAVIAGFKGILEL